MLGRNYGSIVKSLVRLCFGIVHILRLAGMFKSDAPLPHHRYRHRQILQLLAEDTRVRELYYTVLEKFAVQRRTPTEKMWDERRKNIVRNIAEALAGTALSNPEANTFLSWKDKSNISPAPPTVKKNHDNIYCFLHGNREVNIRAGSIHSIKGETHTATLVSSFILHP